MKKEVSGCLYGFSSTYVNIKLFINITFLRYIGNKFSSLTNNLQEYMKMDYLSNEGLFSFVVVLKTLLNKKRKN